MNAFDHFSPEFQSLIAQHFLLGDLKQRMFNQTLDLSLVDSYWKVDLTIPELLLGEEPAQPYAVQLLGTYVLEREQWLWAWANIDSNLPEQSIMAVNALYQFGEDHNVPELVAPTLEISKDNLMQLVTTVNSILGPDANAFFGGNTGSVIAGLLICQSGTTDLRMIDQQTMISTLSQSPLPLDQAKDATEHFFNQCGLEVEIDGDTLAATLPDGNKLIAAFNYDEGTISYEGLISASA